FPTRRSSDLLLNPEFGNEEKLSYLLNNWSRAPKQLELLLSYLHLMKTEGEVTKTNLLKKSGASEAQLKGLMDKDILRKEKRAVDRLHYLPKDVAINFELTPSQRTAKECIDECFQSKQVCLLHGITSSGKTHV